MKTKKISILTAVCALLLGMGSCNYLDKMPDDMLTMEMVFTDKVRTEDWLAGVYSGIPDPMWGYFKRQGWNIMADDINIPGGWTPFGWTNVYQYTLGNWYSGSTWSPNYWSDLPKRIRNALIFIEKATPNESQGMSAEYIERMKYEARFLIVYYYSLMLEIYGPIPCNKYVKLDVDATQEEMMITQSPYDEVVDWLDAEFLEVAKGLPAVYSQSSDWGRPTSVTCYAMRARMLLFAASPLFNGNPDFADWVNGDGVKLFSAADPTKWDRAAKAHKDLIDLALANGYDLYREYDNGAIDPFMSYYNMSQKRFTEGNKEILFGKTWRPTSYEKLNTWQAHQLPASIGGNAGMGVTQELVDAFYTKEGISPILGYNVTGAVGDRVREPIFNPAAAPYYREDGPAAADDVRAGTKWVGLDGVPGKVAEAGKTSAMYTNREPRFYVSVIYHNSWLSVNNTRVNFLAKQADNPDPASFDSNQDGYSVRKGVSVECYPTLKRAPYRPGIIYRLAEAYLSYAEALNESPTNRNTAEILKYVNLVRERAGIPDYAGGTSYEELKRLIHAERRVEFNCEGIRFHDIRRWKIGEETIDGPMMGMNRFGATFDNFHKRVRYRERVFDKKMYIWPVPQAQIDINPNLTQAPGY